MVLLNPINWRPCKHGRQHCLECHKLSKPASNDFLCCPFCGLNDSVNIYTGAEVDESSGREPAKEESYVVICSTWDGGCGATGGYGLTKKQALKKWNTRAT